MNHSIQELHAALQAMRSRPLFSRWPEDLQVVLDDPVRARPARWPPPRPPTTGLDFKSRAAGEIDE